jgi:superfamily II DNA/RNA helicase
MPNEKQIEEEVAQGKFRQCVGCSFYPCELVAEYTMFRDAHPGTDSFSYSPDEFKGSCVFGGTGLIRVECGDKYVADGIGEHFKINTRNKFIDKDDLAKGRWEPKQPIFISAQMGRGKNHFIENTLLPYVKDLNLRKESKQKVLIISNRIALREQIKNRIYGEDANKEYPYKPYADCITYHAFLNRLDHFKYVQENSDRTANYIFVICDEAHFFTSDAMFNPDTEKILSAIARTFHNAIRVYMSATPYDCFQHIRDCEFTEGKEPFVFYHFKRDFSYLITKYYSTHDELKDTVVRSVVEHKEKWIVFIDDKEKCKDFKAKLMEHGDKIGMSVVGKILAVESQSKTEEHYQKMVKNEKLDSDTYVLITTSVLDNGVNFWGIKNIAISDISRVKALQMVGRARREGIDDRKIIYLKRFDEKYINTRIDALERQLSAYNNFDVAFPSKSVHDPDPFRFEFFTKYYQGSYNDWKDAKYWFRLQEKPIKLYANKIARFMASALLPMYRSIAEEMRTEASEGHGSMKFEGQKYLEHQLSWFGKTYSSEDNLNDPGKGLQELLDFLEKFASSGEGILKASQEEFGKDFFRLHNRAFPAPDSHHKNPSRVSKGNHLNMIKKALEKHGINYKVDSNKKTSVWSVVRIDKSEFNEQDTDIEDVATASIE